jgi:hypothetical protein
VVAEAVNRVSDTWANSNNDHSAVIPSAYCVTHSSHVEADTDSQTGDIGPMGVCYLDRDRVGKR